MAICRADKHVICVGNGTLFYERVMSVSLGRGGGCEWSTSYGGEWQRRVLGGGVVNCQRVGGEGVPFPWTPSHGYTQHIGDPNEYLRRQMVYGAHEGGNREGEGMHGMVRMGGDAEFSVRMGDDHLRPGEISVWGGAMRGVTEVGLDSGGRGRMLVITDAGVRGSEVGRSEGSRSSSSGRRGSSAGRAAGDRPARRISNGSLTMMDRPF